MITSFNGTYRFLSNFWPADVVYNGILFPTVEHAFQAAKTHGLIAQIFMSKIATPELAKKQGRKVPIRPDWEHVKLDIMGDLVWYKFKYNYELAQLLKATGEQELIEGNTWGDTFWGQCRGWGIITLAGF